jgi:hypothetical protein
MPVALLVFISFPQNYAPQTSEIPVKQDFFQSNSPYRLALKKVHLSTNIF